MVLPKTSQYGPGHDASHVKHHEWRNAENSAGHLLPHLRRIAGQNPQLKLLDVGAGSGTISASLAQEMPGGQVTATDISGAILQQAAAHAASSGVSNMAFQTASATELPFADATFDVAHAHQVLCHLGEPHRAVEEMLRVVKPGGIIALREVDMLMWCMYPETEGLTDFCRMMAKTMVRNGGHEDAGRRLVSWVMEAGVSRDNIEASFGTWCFSDPADRGVWAGSMVERLRAGPSREQALEYELATVSSISQMIEAWGTWAATEDATLGIMNGEVIVHKPL